MGSLLRTRGDDPEPVVYVNFGVVSAPHTRR